MAEIGKLNRMKVVKELDFGLYLDGGEHGEILLPIRYVPVGTKVGDEIEVFIYFDSEDRIIATTETPFAMVGDFALLKVVSVNAIGAFLEPELDAIPAGEVVERRDRRVERSRPGLAGTPIAGER